MKLNKNMLKDNARMENKPATKSKFYAVIDMKVKVMIDGKEATEVKSFVASAFGTRLQAKQELESLARANGGKITHFGGFR